MNWQIRDSLIIILLMSLGFALAPVWFVLADLTLSGLAWLFGF